MITMGLLYLAVKKQERIAAKWTFPTESSTNSFRMNNNNNKNDADSPDDNRTRSSSLRFTTSNNADSGSPDDNEEKRPSHRMRAPSLRFFNNDADSSDARPSRLRSPSMRFNLRMSSVPRAITDSERTALRQKQKDKARYKKSRAVALQALRYLAVFYVTWMAGTANRLLQLILGQSYFWLMAMHSFFTPLQGFLNFLVYKYPQFSKWQAERKKKAGLLVNTSQEGSRRRFGLSTALEGSNDSDDILGEERKRTSRLNVEEELAAVTNEHRTIENKMEDAREEAPWDDQDSEEEESEGQESRPSIHDIFRLSTREPSGTQQLDAAPEETPPTPENEMFTNSIEC